MKNNTINPLSTMSVEQLKELLKGIDKKFIKHVKDGVIVEDYSKHLDRYQYFLNYLCENKVTLSKGGETLNLSYGLMAQILITHELHNRLNNNKMETQETSKGYICPKTQLQCDDECCVSAEQCHIQESEGLGLKSEMTTKKSSVQWAINEQKTIHALYHFGEIGIETFNRVYKEIIEKANSMHEEESFKTFKAGQESMEEGGKGFDQWYKEIFGGSDGK